MPFFVHIVEKKIVIVMTMMNENDLLLEITNQKMLLFYFARYVGGCSAITATAMMFKDPTPDPKQIGVAIGSIVFIPVILPALALAVPAMFATTAVLGKLDLRVE